MQSKLAKWRIMEWQPFQPEKVEGVGLVIQTRGITRPLLFKFIQQLIDTSVVIAEFKWSILEGIPGGNAGELVRFEFKKYDSAKKEKGKEVPSLGFEYDKLPAEIRNLLIVEDWEAFKKYINDNDEPKLVFNYVTGDNKMWWTYAQTLIDHPHLESFYPDLTDEQKDKLREVHAYLEEKDLDMESLCGPEWRTCLDIWER